MATEFKELLGTLKAHGYDKDDMPLYLLLSSKYKTENDYIYAKIEVQDKHGLDEFALDTSFLCDVHLLAKMYNSSAEVLAAIKNAEHEAEKKVQVAKIVSKLNEQNLDDYFAAEFKKRGDVFFGSEEATIAAGRACVEREAAQEKEKSGTTEEQNKPPKRKFQFTKRLQIITATAASFIVLLTVGLIVYFALQNGDEPSYDVDINTLVERSIDTEQQLQAEVSTEGATAILLEIDGFAFVSCDGYYDGQQLVAYRVKYDKSGEFIIMTVIFKNGYVSGANETDLAVNASPVSINGISVTKRSETSLSMITYMKFKYGTNQIYLIIEPDITNFSHEVVDVITGGGSSNPNNPPK